MRYDTKQIKRRTNLISHLWRMLENQLIILKAGKYGKESSIYPASPRETVCQGNQVVDYRKFPDTEAFELITAKGYTELEYHHLATLLK